MKTAHQKPVIVLDAGHVLVDYDFNLALAEISQKPGATAGRQPAIDLGSTFHPLETGAKTLEGICSELNRATGLELDTDAWRKLCCSFFVGEVPGMRHVLTGLKSGFTLIALSNTMQVHWEFVLETYPIFQLLDGWVVSYEEGVLKPDTAIYRAVSDRFCGGRPPIFFTDDVPQYVEAARNLGWDAEVFSDAAAFKAQIQQRRGTGGPV
jgi:FMN phosphatase YigB (HAD superfamily)